jgi:hypothetical protein
MSEKGIDRLVDVLKASEGRDEIIAAQAIMLFGRDAVEALPVLGDKFAKNHLLQYSIYLPEFMAACGPEGTAKCILATASSLKQGGNVMGIWSLLSTIEQYADVCACGDRVLSALTDLRKTIEDSRRSKAFFTGNQKPMRSTDVSAQQMKEVEAVIAKTLIASEAIIDRLCAKIKAKQSSSASGSPDVACESVGMRIVALLRRNRYSEAIKTHETSAEHRASAMPPREVVDLIDKAFEINAKKPGCFVATACYSSTSAERVLQLQRFRDEQLAPSALGRWLIRLYYRYSPAVVRILERRPVLRMAVRITLVAPLAHIVSTRNGSAEWHSHQERLPSPIPEPNKTDAGDGL